MEANTARPGAKPNHKKAYYFNYLENMEFECKRELNIQLGRAYKHLAVKGDIVPYHMSVYTVPKIWKFKRCYLKKVIYRIYKLLHKFICLTSSNSNKTTYTYTDARTTDTRNRGCIYLYFIHMLAITN